MKALKGRPAEVSEDGLEFKLRLNHLNRHDFNPYGM